MLNFIRKIIKPRYKSLNTIEILKDNLIHNLNYLYSLQEQAEMFPVLKSNAYGHGLKEVAKILNKTQVQMIAVDSFPEAQIAYKNFKRNVLIMSEMPLRAYRYCKFKRTEFIVYNHTTLKYLANIRRKTKIHLFLNTGMNREGIDNLEDFIIKYKKYLDKVEVVGFCSHLAEADNYNSDFNSKQETSFLAGLELLNKYKIYPKWIHLGNSGAIFTFKNKTLNAFRPGLSFYGYSPLIDIIDNEELKEKVNKLKPALRLNSTIITVHKIKTGEKVSYDNNFIAPKNMNIAVIPFGYFEGLDRRFSNNAKFLFNKEKDIFWTKISGNICMNLTCLNCGNREVAVGDQVNIISELKNMENSVYNLSNKINIIPYEMLVNLDFSIKRTVI